jgi:hypothetical protein
VDDRDPADAERRIDASPLPAGGRKVAGSNPVAPIPSAARIARTAPPGTACGRKRTRHQGARTAEVARRFRWTDVVKTIEFRSSWSFHIVALPE